MKKKIVFISIIIAIIAIASVFLYNTYATDPVSPNDSYSITLTGDTTVSVPRYSYKDIIYQIKNTNNGTVKYGVGYTSTTGNSVVKVFTDSTDPATGTIEANAYKYIKIRIENRTTTADTVSLSTILGYENGGDLPTPSGTTIVTLPVVEDNPIVDNSLVSNGIQYFYINTLPRTNIESIEYKKFSDIPDGATTTDISKNKDGSVLLWYTDGETSGNYKVYIASFSGKIVADTSMEQMFNGCSILTTLDLSSFDTSNVVNMSRMFRSCSLLEELDVSSFNTSSVTNMSYMFDGCSSLKKLDLSNFDNSKASSFNYFLSGCTSLEYLDVSNFSNKSIQGASPGYFEGLSNLKTLVLTNFKTDTLTSMRRMFYGCSSLTSLDLSSFNTSKVTDMASMFYGCSGLISLNLSNFETPVLTNATLTFNNCTSLTSIDLRKADFSSVSSKSDAFKNVPNTCEVIVKDCEQYSKFRSLWNTSAFKGTLKTVNNDTCS